MKKTLIVLMLVFGFAFAMGSLTPSTADAGNCYFTCTCSGTPLYCCVNNGVTTCKFTSKIYCTQGYNC